MKIFSKILLIAMLSTGITKNSFSQFGENRFDRSSSHMSSQRMTTPSTSAVEANPFASSSQGFSLQSGPGGNPDVPIDGGISLLIAAGAAPWGKKAHSARKKAKANTSI